MDIHATEVELRDLMVAGLDGNATAHKTLLSRVSVYLRGYFRNHLASANRGAAEAEDLVQEVLIAIHTQRHTYDRTRLFTPWMYAIARYKFLDYLRRTSAEARDVPVEEAEEVLAHNDHAAVESSLDLESLLAGISEQARRAIQYVKLEGLSVREAAQRCGISESALKVTVHRGMKALALRIRERSS